MKSKILNALLIVTSLFGFLEWGQGNQQFLFQVEGEIVSKFLEAPASVLHPFTILPLFGQVFLLITLFQKLPSKILSYWGIGGIGILFALILLVGCLSLNAKILLSTLPFLTLAFFTVRHLLKMKSEYSK